jgi:hypothetical protein
MFPSGWPGKGLLLLRLGAGIVLTHDGVAETLMASDWHGIIWQALAAIGSILLLIGLCTPIAGVLVVIVGLRTALSKADNLRTCIVLAVVGAALAMLGPAPGPLTRGFSDESVLTSVVGRVLELRRSPQW